LNNWLDLFDKKESLTGTTMLGGEVKDEVKGKHLH